MKIKKQPYQKLFNYLANELNAIALQTQLQEIEKIVMSKFKKQAKKNIIKKNNRKAR